MVPLVWLPWKITCSWVWVVGFGLSKQVRPWYSKVWWPWGSRTSTVQGPWVKWEELDFQGSSPPSDRQSPSLCLWCQNVPILESLLLGVCSVLRGRWLMWSVSFLPQYAFKMEPCQSWELQNKPGAGDSHLQIVTSPFGGWAWKGHFCNL